jgi:hypothetical protein
MRSNIGGAIRVNLLGSYKEKRIVEGVVTAKVRFLVGCENAKDATDSIKELFDDHYDEIVNNSFLRDGIASLECKVMDVGENLVVNG